MQRQRRRAEARLRERMIAGSVTASAMLLMVAVVLAVALRGAGTPSVAPPEDTNPTGRETPSGKFGTVPGIRPGPTATITPTPTPAIAPPRGTIAYERGGTIYLLVIGGQERALVPAGQQPKLAPDGGRIVYIGRTAQGAGQLLVADTRTRAVSLVTDKAPSPALPAWSPDGGRIAFRAAAGETTEIFTVNADGTNLQQVTRAATKAEGATQPAWTADGRSLLYKNQADGAFYRVPAAGGAPVRLRPADGTQYDIAASPDGALLAFTQRRPQETDFSLVITDPSGGNERLITALPSISAAEQLGGIAWSPDSRSVLVASGGSFRLEAYDVRTGRPSAVIAYGVWPSWVAAEIAA